MRTNKFKEIVTSTDDDTKTYLYKFLASLELKDGTKQNASAWKTALETLVHKKTSQEKIYAHIRDICKQENSFNNIQRAKTLAKRITNELKYYRPYKRYNSILDIGCATGAITTELMQELKIPASRAYGTDVDDYPITKFNFIKTTQNTETFDAIKPASIDLITCSMSLHHIINIEQTLNELCRVISPSGILIIREHDCKTPMFAYYLDIVHGLYELSLGEKIAHNFLKEYEAYYKSKQEWRQLITNAGFKIVYQTPPLPNMRAYYSVYVKHVTK